MDKNDDLTMGFLVIMLFMACVFGIGIIFSSMGHVVLSQETVDEICYNLTGQSGVVANSINSEKLECKLPSFDSTQNIIIKSNGERE